MVVELGVEVLGDFAERGEIHVVQTPSGEVATATHYGDNYTQMAPIYEAPEQWCASSGRRASGVSLLRGGRYVYEEDEAAGKPQSAGQAALERTARA